MKEGIGYRKTSCVKTLIQRSLYNQSLLDFCVTTSQIFKYSVMSPILDKDYGLTQCDVHCALSWEGTIRMFFQASFSSNCVSNLFHISFLRDFVVILYMFNSHPLTVVQNNQESECKYWATRFSVPSFNRTTHLFACSAVLAFLMRSAALTHLLTHSFLGSW